MWAQGGFLEAFLDEYGRTRGSSLSYGLEAVRLERLGADYLGKWYLAAALSFVPSLTSMAWCRHLDRARNHAIDLLFPEQADRTRINAGKVDLGMPEDMAFAIAGTPSHEDARANPDGSQVKVWTYRRLGLFTRLKVTLHDGIVVGVVK
jgi:hypothetical protein